MLSQPVKQPLFRVNVHAMANAAPSFSQGFPLVRAARRADAEALARLAKELLRYEQQLNQQMGELTPWAATASELRKQMQQPNIKFFLAERDGELVGYVKVVAYGLKCTPQTVGWHLWLKEKLINFARQTFELLVRHPRRNVELAGGFIAGAFVKPEARRSHVGRALVNAAEHWLQKQGLASSELQVLHANVEARQFWESLGYEPLVLGMRKRLNKDDQ
jgi:ribosomal protein S18 acetylase RimI-like enzyme